MDGVVIIVLSSFATGTLPDAKKYNDEEANTLTHSNISDFNLPNLAKLGLYKLITNYRLLKCLKCQKVRILQQDYYETPKYFDDKLQEIIDTLKENTIKENDLLIITLSRVMI